MVSSIYAAALKPVVWTIDEIVSVPEKAWYGSGLNKLVVGTLVHFGRVGSDVSFMPSTPVTSVWRRKPVWNFMLRSSCSSNIVSTLFAASSFRFTIIWLRGVASVGATPVTDEMTCGSV